MPTPGESGAAPDVTPAVTPDIASSGSYLGTSLRAHATGLPCVQCGQPLRILELPGHYGKKVEIDVCMGCHLIWFDGLEPARLQGLGMLRLIETMAEGATIAHHRLHSNVPCLRCHAPTQPVQNISRWGRSIHLKCSAGRVATGQSASTQLQEHGSWQTFGEFLQEKGLIRPMSLVDRNKLIQKNGSIQCVACGGDIGLNDLACHWCGTQPALLDVQRLVNALDWEGASASRFSPGSGTKKLAWRCMACGAGQADHNDLSQTLQGQASPPGPASANAPPNGLSRPSSTSRLTAVSDAPLACSSCGATWATPKLSEVLTALRGLKPILEAHAQRPDPRVVRERLQRQEAGIAAQKERNAKMFEEERHRRYGQGWMGSPSSSRRTTEEWDLVDLWNFFVDHDRPWHSKMGLLLVMVVCVLALSRFFTG